MRSQFPDPLVTVLAQLDDARVPQVATSWGKTEELDCPGAELRPIINDLRRLARSSRRSSKAMFLWGSL